MTSTEDNNFQNGIFAFYTGYHRRKLRSFVLSCVVLRECGKADYGRKALFVQVP